MDINNNKVLICNCENTMQIDGDKLGKACESNSCTIYSNLCNQELSIVDDVKIVKETKKFDDCMYKKQKHLNLMQKIKNFLTQNI